MTAPRRIVIQPYNASWPAEFARVEAALLGALGDIAHRIDHIGSTSVPGLAAKDVIDVQISVPDLTGPGPGACAREPRCHDDRHHP